MRNSGLAGADGPGNLLAALRVAASPLARDVGPVVVFADEIHLPRFVRKLHSASIHAFGSPTTGPIGWVIEDRVRIPLVPRRRGPVCTPDDLPATIPEVGILRLGLGSGPVRPEHVAGVDSLSEIAARIPVVMATRTGAGELYEATYAFPGSERDLLDRGLISAVALDGAKARLQLILLLAGHADRATIRESFETLFGAGAAAGEEP
jgi:L-asparaginase